jgi:hypothetical protein
MRIEMTDFFSYIGVDQPAVYEIRVQGRMEEDLTDWFQGEAACRVESIELGKTVTILVGWVIDQAALHGLLTHIRDLGLTLLFVDCLTAHQGQQPGSESS